MNSLLYRPGTYDDLDALKNLAIKSWTQFKQYLTTENWDKLQMSLSDPKTYAELLEKSHCIVCSTNESRLIGMAFLVPRNNPTDIYDKEWSYIRFVTVDPDFEGQGIGRKLTTNCISVARQNNEHTIALHTSEIMSKARHIYENLGFKVLREIDPRIGKRYWLYALDLE